MPGPILVTGAAGFAGSHLLDLLERQAEIVAWHRPGGSPPFRAPGTVWQAVDLLDPDRRSAGHRRSSAGRRVPLRRGSARRPVVGRDRTDIRRQRPRDPSSAQRAAPLRRRSARDASQLGDGVQTRGSAAERRRPAPAAESVRVEQARDGAARTAGDVESAGGHDRATVQPYRSAAGTPCSPPLASRSRLRKSRPVCATARSWSAISTRAVR